jgi:hypothetical protein
MSNTYKLTGLTRSGRRVTIANCNSLREAMKWEGLYRTSRGLRRYQDIEIIYP